MGMESIQGPSPVTSLKRLVVSPHFKALLNSDQDNQMPLMPRQYHKEMSPREKPLNHSANGVSMAMALMVESMVHMVHNAQALQKGAS
jgi:hypothetical protein